MNAALSSIHDGQDSGGGKPQPSKLQFKIISVSDRRWRTPVPDPFRPARGSTLPCSRAPVYEAALGTNVAVKENAHTHERSAA